MQDVTFSYEDFDPESEGLREALTSTGNGYFCTRGTAIFGGSPVLNEDLVNLPNWLVLKLRIEGDEAIRLDNVKLLSYRHDYDIRLAMVQRELRFRDRAGRETTLRSRRVVSTPKLSVSMQWVEATRPW